MKIEISFYTVFIWAMLGTAMPSVAGLDASTAQAVPDLVGLNEAKAQSEIMSAGMILGSTTQSSSALIPAGDIIGQTPVSGTPVKPGTAVDIVVSTGPARFGIPDVVGLSQADAQDKITAAELVVGRVATNNSENVPIGYVISQVPLAEVLLPQGGAVNLVVSSGPP